MDWRKLLVGLLIGGASAGCNRQPYHLVHVSGRIRLDGAPLANAKIGFEPLKVETTGGAIVGPGSYGTTDASGNFAFDICATAPPERRLEPIACGFERSRPRNFREKASR